jgi:hypothetical protein
MQDLQYEPVRQDASSARSFTVCGLHKRESMIELEHQELTFPLQKYIELRRNKKNHAPTRKKNCGLCE